jgi:hypothetical protein
MSESYQPQINGRIPNGTSPNEPTSSQNPNQNRVSNVSVVSNENGNNQRDGNLQLSEISISQIRPARLPLKSVKVYSPHLKESVVNNYILYKVGFVWNDRDFEVTRRYSDFKALRKALSHLLPFTFIFPMHRKQVIVSSQGKPEEGLRPRPQTGAQSLLRVHCLPADSLQRRYDHQTPCMTSSM